MNERLTDIDTAPSPLGKLTLQAVTMPKDTNASGDIFGGWLLSQMDLAGGVAAAEVAQGRVATVAIDKMSFLVPVEVGAVISCYTEVKAVRRSSIHIDIEVWKSARSGRSKVTDGVFVYVAIDENGRTRMLPGK